MQVKELFLLGAPKCGTSALYYYLNSLTEFSGCVPKESNQWLQESHPLKKDLKLEGPIKSIYLEASPNNFYHPSKELLSKQSDDDVRFVLILRDPVERLISSFNYTKHNLGRIKGNFHIDDYVEKILNDDYGWIKYKVQGKVSQFVLRRDLSYGKYVQHLDVWNDAFSKNNLLIVSQKELINNPETVLNRILKHCSLDNAVTLSDSIKNKTRSYKFPLLHRALYSLNKRFPSPRVLREFYLKYFESNTLDQISTKNRIKLKKYYEESVVDLGEKYKFYL